MAYCLLCFFYYRIFCIKLQTIKMKTKRKSKQTLYLRLNAFANPQTKNRTVHQLRLHHPNPATFKSFSRYKRPISNTIQFSQPGSFSGKTIVQSPHCFFLSFPLLIFKSFAQFRRIVYICLFQKFY